MIVFCSGICFDSSTVHRAGGVLSFRKRTIDPSFIICRSLVHSCPMLNSLRYSLYQRSQKSRLTFDMCYQEKSLFVRMLLKSCTSAVLSVVCRLKKWPGVNTCRSLEFDDMVVISREFSMDSTFIRFLRK